MPTNLAALIKKLVTSPEGGIGLAGLDAPAQFQAPGKSSFDSVRRLNAAFLLALTGDEDAVGYLQTKADEESLAGFYLRGIQRIVGEFNQACAEDRELELRVKSASRELTLGAVSGQEALKLFWEVFFPEGLSGLGDRLQAVDELRRRRRVEIIHNNPQPLDNPARQVLFTSNVLLTLPSPDADTDNLGLDRALHEELAQARQAPQDFWYDHPIPLGVAPRNNEVLHGLDGLNRTLTFEKKRKPEWSQENLTCLLSVSVTHKGLHRLARQYLSRLLAEAPQRRGLEVYIFTEDQTDRLKQETLLPALEHYLPGTDPGPLKEVMGVDGEYGRHYSFLKAIAVWWNLLIDPQKKATFKIDLDQIFPQEELLAQTGATALEHFCSPLWGALGRDAWGQEVELGLLAGALVNQADISQGLFTPDVTWPKGDALGDDWVFFSGLPQALSTQAEMMTRYDEEFIDGRRACLQRVHVTGGTTGALVKSLRKHRPFTPGFIGRAEDQAYLLSVLEGSPANLRYLHESGLIMRHDKEALTPQAIAAAKTGKTIGDYLRILYFSRYARDLPWGLDKIKQAVDPFTGCFISRLPFNVIHLRLALRAAFLFAHDQSGAALDLLNQGAARLGRVMDLLDEDPAYFSRWYQREKMGWQVFYDLLDRLEQGLEQEEAFAGKIKEKAVALARDCLV